MDRRQFVSASAVIGAGICLDSAAAAAAPEGAKAMPFKISLAEWSLHRTFNHDGSDNLRFPEIARQQCGIEAVEFVNRFFMDKARDAKYLAELSQRCRDQDVKCLLIMCDDVGDLGDPDEKQRRTAVENHHKWVEAAKDLGCHSIRVNARSGGTYEEQRDRAADGLSKLGEYAAQHGLNVIVENHGGLSSNGAWLATVMKQVGRENVGTLPDFGNFQLEDGTYYDRYQGVQELMPFAKAVSAKSKKFDARGEEVDTDYLKMLRIVLQAGYDGYVGIEWEGEEPDELAGIALTKKLLERVRDQLATEL